MPKLMWNGFLEKHQGAGILLVGAWHNENARRKTGKGIIVPSPYELFLKVLKTELQGDWAATSVKPKRAPRNPKAPPPTPLTVIQILVQDMTEAGLVNKLIPLRVPQQTGAVPPHCSAMFNFTYEIKQYADFCARLGY